MNNLLKPKKTKFKKQQRRNFRKPQINKLTKGHYGLIALENFWFSSEQVESCRKTILRYTKRVGNIFFNVFPDKPITKRTEGARMGTGKGSVSYWVMPIREKKILIELKNVPKLLAKQALIQVSHKLPVKTEIYEKDWNCFK